MIFCVVAHDFKALMLMSNNIALLYTCTFIDYNTHEYFFFRKICICQMHFAKVFCFNIIRSTVHCQYESCKI